MSGIMNMFVAAKTTVAAAVDAFFNLTTLLLNTSSTNGAQNNTFLDSSTNNFTITRNGNTTQGTFTPFSQTGWSNYFNAANTDYLTATSNAAYQFGTGNFTIEFWIYHSTPSTSTNSPKVFQYADDGNYTNGYGAYFTTSSTTFNYNGPAAPYTLTGTVAANSWNHVAIVRNSSTTTLYINGTSASSNADSLNYNYAGTYPLAIGSGRNGAGNYSSALTGYISNFRIVKGTAVYTSAFTPPTTPLTAITNTSLLTCQSNRFLDNSTNAFAITVNGTPSVQAFSPFAPTAAYDTAVVGGSGYFDGTGDYLSIASNAAFTFTGDFTWEGWFYMTANPSQSYSTRLIDYNGGSNFLVFSTSDGTDYLGFVVAGTTYTTTTALPRRQWAHVAVSRSGTGSNNLKLFLNGTAISTQTNTSTVTATDIYISNRPSGDGYFTGYIGSYRMTNTGLYTTTFTPATSPFTAVTGTALLLNYTNSGIFDSTAKNVLETVGNAQVSTTQAKWGTTSMYFDGTGDALLIPTAQLLTIGTGDFTIEGWINPSSQVNAYGTIFGASASNGVVLSLRGSGTASSISMNPYGSADIFNYSYTFTTSTWYHVAVTRSGTSLRIFINGTQLSSTVTNSTNWGAIRVIGGIDSGASQNYTGYMDDARITLGYARYTANFTTPTAAFPLL
jgi:hypothetical protein